MRQALRTTDMQINKRNQTRGSKEVQFNRLPSQVGKHSSTDIKKVNRQTNTET